jgi:predicted adenine nucleotide alpha hydrolase (AANH) superfamily ATPase
LRPTKNKGCDILQEKINYDNKRIAILNSLDYIPHILLHSCCAPCSSYCIESLTKYMDITILYYNPNIEPYDEYDKRKQEEIRFIKEYPHINKLDIIDCDYDNQKYHEIVKGLEDAKEGGERCFKCYNMRLEYTAALAKKIGYDYFGTTLSVSPYKNSQKINEIGSILEDKYNINFLYADFKKQNGYQRSIDLSHEYNLYRQNYCGCIYSKKDNKNE